MQIIALGYSRFLPGFMSHSLRDFHILTCLKNKFLVVRSKESGYS